MKPKQEQRECKCGCGKRTVRFFRPGHDARLKSALPKVERGELKVADLPATVRKAYHWERRGPGYIPTRDYAGRPHKGYAQ